MASTRLNVLVYAGPGSTIESVRHCVFTLRRLLAPRYAVLTVTAAALVHEPWPATCALLVMPGGADAAYCAALDGAGNRRIRRYLESAAPGAGEGGSGGAYLGFCAGGYYGSARCEFEVDDPVLAVVGRRELALFPGSCRGCAYKGFQYHSEAGARAVELSVDATALPPADDADGAGDGDKVDAVPSSFRSYYNGGGVFVDAPRYADKGVEVLASYTGPLDVDPGAGMAAVVYCPVGQGGAILTGPHPEFAAVNLDPDADGPEFADVIDALRADDGPRTAFLRACLRKLGLRVNAGQNAVPSLSRMHLSSATTGAVTEAVAALQEALVTEDGEELLRDDADTFVFEKPSSAWSTAALKDALVETSNVNDGSADDAPADAEDRILDYTTIRKRVVVHEAGLPPARETPCFNHHAYFAGLAHYQEEEPDEAADAAFGRLLLYAEVITSTNSILEKNTELLRRLPSGFLATATVQVAGRGRGANVWVSPAGALMFSLVVRHPMALMPKAPVVFLQYLAAMAVVEGVHAYDAGYDQLPLRLKWPNDIYALDPAAGHAPVKIGGVLVNSHYSATEYLSVVGVGLNATNALPTTSLAALARAAGRPAPTAERLLARLVTTFASLYMRFRATGFDRWFERRYYAHWLHTDQAVTLEAEGGMRARIRGITTDWGLLVAEELVVGVDGREKGTGRTVQLQSDSNSFDFFKGLVKRKT